MIIRNFRVAAGSDNGRTHTAMPRGKGEGLSVRLSQRDSGSIIEDAVVVECIARTDGTLYTRVKVIGHEAVEFITTR